MLGGRKFKGESSCIMTDDLRGMKRVMERGGKQEGGKGGGDREERKRNKEGERSN